MFFAYNNGVTATAEDVDFQDVDGTLLVTRLRNLQIVNGGQTTASIHAASRKRDVDLSNVFVQMKLSIVEPEQAVEVVPKISEFANSQNRVNAADFFSNHPFHVRMEEFSLGVCTPHPSTERSANRSGFMSVLAANTKTLAGTSARHSGKHSTSNTPNDKSLQKPIWRSS